MADTKDVFKMKLKADAHSANDHVRLAAAKDLNQLGPAALPDLNALASDRNDIVRLAMAQALTSAGPGAVPLLQPLTADPNDFVRLAAKEAVFTIAHESLDLEAARLGLQVVRDGNVRVRLAARELLKSLPRDLIAAAYVPPKPPTGYETDCLDRCFVPTQNGPLFPQGSRLCCDVCVILIATPGLEPLLDMCLRSLTKNGGLEGLDAVTIAFIPDADEACRAVCRSHGAMCIEAIPLIAPHASLKGMAYSVQRWVDARCYLVLEPDMLVLDSLREIVEQVLDGPGDQLFGVQSSTSLWAQEAAQHHEGQWPPNLQEWINRCFAGEGDDVQFLLGEAAGEAESKQFSLFFNAGLFVGGPQALQQVEAQILAMQPFASLWIDTAHIYWWDEMVWNIAYGQAGNAAALPKRYNYEPGPGELGGLHHDPQTGSYRPNLPPGEVAVYHFIGLSKAWMPFYVKAYGIS